MATAYDTSAPLPPIPVRMNGFTSDTVTLAHHGWEFFTQYKVDYMSTMMVLRYKSKMGYCTFQLSQLVHDMRDMMEFQEARRCVTFEFDFDQMNSQETVVDTRVLSQELYQVDMQQAHMPMSMREQQTGFKSFIETIFPRKDQGEIWLPESAKVADLLDEILDQQVERNDEIKSNQRRREAGSIILLSEHAA